MALFPQSFLDDLRLQADIVQVVQETVSLRRVGGTYKGLCPFHNEKTPSFHVDRERGFFHCFGCGVGGNVFKFVELHERLSFPEAVRVVAKKFGVALPETGDARHDPNADAERENLITLHEVAAKFYRDVLRVGGRPARPRPARQARPVDPRSSSRSATASRRRAATRCSRTCAARACRRSSRSRPASSSIARAASPTGSGTA